MHQIQRASTPGILVLDMIPVGIPCVLYSNAILYVSIPGTAVITVSEPILNPVWGVWFVGEAPWNFPRLGGAVIPAAGMVQKLLLQKECRDRRDNRGMLKLDPLSCRYALIKGMLSVTDFR